MHCSRRLIVQTLVFSRSYLHRQVSPPETLVVKGGTTWARKGRWILPENARLPHNIQESFTCRKSTTWLYFPSEGRRSEDFFALKSPTSSAGFEPANLGTKGQHATSRPPKPLSSSLYLSAFLSRQIVFETVLSTRTLTQIRKVMSLNVYLSICTLLNHLNSNPCSDQLLLLI